jgi:dethiobiotin synthetase
MTQLAAKYRFLVSGTDTGVGKTTIGCGLAAAFRLRGMRIGVMKPAETGCLAHDGELTALDAIALREAAESNDAIELVCPYRYETPLAPAAAAVIEGMEPPELRRIAAIYERLAADRDVMLVEGAGGLAVPITWRENYADLALALDLELILVVGNRLGCINATVLSLAYAAQRGVRIKGYILNDVETEYSPAVQTNARSLESLLPGRCLGLTKYKHPLPGEVCERVLS